MDFTRSSLAAVLVLVSSTVFAQHTSSSHTSSSSSSASHTSSPSVAATHSGPASPAMHTSSPAATSHSAPATTVVKVDSNNDAEPARKIVTPVETRDPKVELKDEPKGEPKEKNDLSRPVLCDGKPCVQNGGEEKDLRKHVCLKEPCAAPCPAGTATGKAGGCTGTAAPTASARRIPQACPAGEAWNGAVCVPTGIRCQPGQISIGASCQADCATINGQSGSLILELRSARQQRDEACQQASQSTQCQQAEMSYSAALQRYQMLLAGAPTQCRSGLPDPISI